MWHSSHISTSSNELVASINRSSTGWNRQIVFYLAEQELKRTIALGASGLLQQLIEADAVDNGLPVAGARLATGLGGGSQVDGGLLLGGGGAEAVSEFIKLSTKFAGDLLCLVCLCKVLGLLSNG